ncbi:hypothetical protein [Ekhidna sp.]|uniref:hypothetical protein n=1 Tax=Ekhidna sp. TaxID=2608089 RepID=UPI003299032B
MRHAAKLLSLVILLALSGCFEKEVFSEVPLLSFDDVVFIDAPNDGPNRAVDTLIVTFSFEDEGGDFGLDPSLDVGPPHHIFDGVFDSLENVVTINGSGYTPPFYSIPIGLFNTNEGAQYFYFPDSAELIGNTISPPPYNCDEYLIIENDTIYGKQNPFYNNFFVIIERKIGEDEYEPLLVDPCAPGFNGRIPVFDPEGKEGQIVWKQTTNTLRLTLGDDIWRVRIYVYDRSLNKSNEVFSQDFIITDITQKIAG